MDRTSADGFVLNTAGNRIRVGENLTAGTQGTETDPNYDNDQQEELIGGLIQYVGLTPTAGAVRQIQQALFRLFGGNITTVSTSQVLTADNSGLVLVNASGGNLALTLPVVASANGAIFRYEFLRTDTSTNTVTLLTAASEKIAPGALSSLPLVAGQPFELTADASASAGNGIWRLAISASTIQEPYYIASQTTPITPVNNTVYIVAGTTVVFPEFSSTGAFRVYGRMKSSGLTTGAGANNFTCRLTDGTNVYFGAGWLIVSDGSGDSWGTSDFFKLPGTYAPGTSQGFLLEVGSAGGATSFTLEGCFFELYVVEA